jgi:glutamate-ammonia-ligase adenylyltransferase
MTQNLSAKDLILAPELTTEQVNQILEPYSFQDVSRAARNLQNLAVGLSPLPQAFNEIVEFLLKSVADSPDPDAALNNFERFAAATFDRLWLYRLLREAPFLLRMLTTCFGASAYLSDILVRNPEYFYELIDANVMSEPKNREMMYSELTKSVGLFQLAEQKLNAMRRYKRKETLRIGLRDLLGDADLETTTLELTNLAEAALQVCYEIGTAELTAKFGMPYGQLPDVEKVPSTFAVIAMGKFGGYELNFSSDIDVMFVYSHDGKTDEGVENRHYFAKLCEFIINGLSEVTVAGYVFRVDARLRPQSSVGVIARSIDSYEAYYEGWGEIWERQALIKARPVAGDPKLGGQFIRMLQPFVYQRYLDEFSIAEIKLDIRQTKARIERRISEKASVHTHVKLGIGGIRDIEFIIQCLQLIHGGPLPALRNRNSLESIDLLYRQGLLNPTDQHILAEAYRFLRMVEHRIQMEADQQRYSLPSKAADVIKLAKCMRYRDTESASAPEAFQADYTRHTLAVRSIFEKILAVPVSEGGVDIALLLTTTDGEVIRDLLNPIGFADPRDAQRQLRFMAEGPDGVRFSPQVRRQFVALAPTLLHFLQESPDPDMALRYIESFSSKAGARSAYYAMFREKPSILELLTKLCGTSRFLADLLITHPESFDILTVSSIMNRPKTLAEKQRETLWAIAEVTDAQLFGVLRHYKNSEILRIGMRNILGQADLWTTTAELSDLAEATLQAMYARIKEEFQAKHGVPLDANGTESTFAVIGMGKFGGRELNFSADLDVMFVYAAEGKTTKGLPNADYFSKLGLELINRMKGNTGGGVIYELDLRLRPFGTGGAIALSLAGYQNYYDKHAETWERQALIRARPVAGDVELGERFLERAHAFAYNQPLTADQVAQILHNRQRKEAQATRTTTRRRRGRVSLPANRKTRDVKSGYGGLVDIEFAVQTLQLIYGTDHPQVRAQNTVEAITRLQEVGGLTGDQRTQLVSAYEFLRGVENSLRIVHDRPLHALPDKAAELEKLAKRLGYVDGDERAAEQFLRDYQECTERTRALFNQLLNSNG